MQIVKSKEAFPAAAWEILEKNYQDIVKTVLDNSSDVHKAVASLDSQLLLNLTSFASIQTQLENIYDEPLEDTDVYDELNYLVNECCNCFDWTPLHIAVAVNNVKAVEILINTKYCDPNLKDTNGATPLHHCAVLGRGTIIEKLLSSGANPLIKDAYGGTYNDIFALCHPSPEQNTQCLITLESGAQKPVNEGLFFEMTGAHFLSSENALSPLVWLANWTNQKYAEKLSNQQIAMQVYYQKYRQCVPKNFCLEHDPKIGYYLRANENIGKHQIIGEYFGKIDTDALEKKQADYQTEYTKSVNNDLTNAQKSFFYTEDTSMHYIFDGAIDAFEYRGALGLIADSFPNIIVHTVSQVRGLYNRVIFITRHAIQAGDILAIDYGKSHPVKKMSFTELRRKKMHEFCKNTSVNAQIAILDKLSKKPNTLTEKFSAYSDVCAVDYILNSPTAMLDLYLNDLLSCKDISTIYAKRIELRGASTFGAISMLMQGKDMQELFLDAIKTFNKACLKSKDKNKIKEAKTDLLNQMGKMTTLELYDRLRQHPAFKRG